MRAWRDLVLPRGARVGRRAPGGLHAFTRRRDGQPLRLHLRVEEDGSGLLLVAAAQAIRLAPAATAAAHALLSKQDEQLALRASGSEDVVARVAELLDELGRPGRRHPVFNLDDPSLVRGGRLMAPFEADVVVSPGDGMGRLRRVIDGLWEAGVPHVRFRVPEGRLEEVVVQAIERAEDVGFVTGLRVARPPELALDALDRAVAAGLDHVTVAWPATGTSENPAIPALRRARELETCPVAEIPLVAATLPRLDATLAELRQLGVENAQAWAVATDAAVETDVVAAERSAGVDRNAGSVASIAGETTRSPRRGESAADAGGALPGAALRQVAAWAEERADLDDVRVTWVPPALRDPSIPLAEQLARGPRAASIFSIRVEADGSVLPPRGSADPGGNLLSEPWRTIWSRPAFRRHRELAERDTRCDPCPGLALCAADCPADPRGWSAP